MSRREVPGIEEFVVGTVAGSCRSTYCSCSVRSGSDSSPSFVAEVGLSKEKLVCAGGGLARCAASRASRHSLRAFMLSIIERCSGEMKCC